MRLPETHSNQVGLPPELAQPARRALIGAGYTHLEQLAEVSEAEIRRLHGIGPNALRILRRAMQDIGLTFKEQ